MDTDNRLIIVVALSIALASPIAISAQGGSPGTGDVFGDLIHILRNVETGQPILAQRWVELPAGVIGYGWGYCPVAVDAEGNEIGFIPYTCDPIDPTAVQEVDYFGRLNSTRTRERNLRMHFDEVISTIKTADWVDSSGCGRLRLFFDCSVQGDPSTCLDWKLVDSPLENLGLYIRLAKYGHLQTDPLEIDTGSHGDPSVPVVYHPALGPEDWGKLDPSVRHLLPGDGAGTCFPGGVFDPDCASPELLDARDLVRGAGFLAGGADKDGYFTADLVQYMGRIAKLTQDTPMTVSTLATLPAVVRDCWPSTIDPPDPPEDDPAPVDPPYLPPADCTIEAASSGLPNYSLFTDVQERFVDFAPFAYEREDWRSALVEVILPVDIDHWERTLGYSLLPWIQFRNGSDGADNIAGFVLAANDSLRWIEFIHNYEVPADLLSELLRLVFWDGFESGDSSAWIQSTAWRAHVNAGRWEAPRDP